VVRPATGANDLAVAEYVMTATLLLRRAWFASDRVAQGLWPRMDLIGWELAGKRLGLVGLGANARLTAAKAALPRHSPQASSAERRWTCSRPSP
jgi:(S)-sulfolactate dehydrogenase